MIPRRLSSPIARSLPARLALARCLHADARDILQSLGIQPETLVKGVHGSKGWQHGTGTVVESIDKATGEVLASVAGATTSEVKDTILPQARIAQQQFRKVPAPKRGEILRQIRNKLAAHRDDLGALISLEMGKVLSEGIGEVQEFLDVADYAVGLSRQLNGAIMPSERPNHSLMEVPNPLGQVGVISAFNFPNAVFGWNFALSFISGNSTIWKPSETTPLISIATTRLIAEVLEANDVPVGVASLICGGREAGIALAESKLTNLLSFTGSEAVGKTVSVYVGKRLGKQLLELGGNNAAVVMPTANLPLAVRTVCFGALGTAGQRCTSTRRLFLHQKIANSFLSQLTKAYADIVPSRIGHPLSPGVLCGPLHSKAAKESFMATIETAKAKGGRVLFGGKEHIPSDAALQAGHWVEPTVIIFDGRAASPRVMFEECFAPILFVKTFATLEEGIAYNNEVQQGLSSTLFTQDMQDVFTWLGPEGSDCGIVNVNASTSGAEIGGAFGGNKATGGGRESGGDSWRQYSRWSTAVVNYSGQMPLAQGVQFS